MLTDHCSSFYLKLLHVPVPRNGTYGLNKYFFNKLFYRLFCFCKCSQQVEKNLINKIFEFRRMRYRIWNIRIWWLCHVETFLNVNRRFTLESSQSIEFDQLVTVVINLLLHTTFLYSFQVALLCRWAYYSHPRDNSITNGFTSFGKVFL